MDFFEKFAKFHDYFEIRHEWKDVYYDHDDNIKCDLSWLEIKEDVFYLTMSIQSGDLYVYLDIPLSNGSYRQKVLDDFENSEIASINDNATYIKVGNMNSFDETDIERISGIVSGYMKEYEKTHKESASNRITFSMINRLVLIHTKIRLGTFPNCKTLLEECKKDSSQKSGICLSTINNDIRRLKDIYRAPLEFDRSKNGYHYTEDFSLDLTLGNFELR